MTDINISRYATIGFLALFSGLRKFLLIFCLMGLVASAVLFKFGDVRYTPSLVPSDCSGYIYDVAGHNPPTGALGGPGGWYVRRGDGFCFLVRDTAGYYIINKVYNTRWFLRPTNVNPNSIETLPEDRIFASLWMLVGSISIALLFGLWLPATLLAMAGRKAKEFIRE